MTGVEEVPVARDHPPFGLHAGEQSRAGIRRLDVKRRGRDAVLDRPIHGPPEHIGVVVVHAEDEAAVDHDAERVQPAGHGRVVPAEVLSLVALHQIAGRERLESDEDAAEPGLGRALDQIATKDRVHRRRTLEEPAHAAHAVEQRRREVRIAQQVIVEKVEMPSGQP